MIDKKQFEKFIKDVEEVYKKVNVMIPQMQKEINSLRGVDFSQLIKGDVKKIEEFSQSIINCVNIVGNGIDNIFSTSLNVEKVTSKISEGIKKVGENVSTAKEVFSSTKAELEKLGEIDFKKMSEGDFSPLIKSGDILIDILKNLGEKGDKFTDSQFNLSEMASVLASKYENVKDKVGTLGEAFSSAKIEFEKITELDLTKVSNGDFSPFIEGADGLVNILGILAKAGDKVTEGQFNLSEMASVLASKYADVKDKVLIVSDAFSLVRDEVGKFGEIKFGETPSEQLNSIATAGDGAINIMGIFAETLEKVSGRSLGLSETVGKIQNGFDSLKSGMASVGEAMQKALNPNLVIEFSGNLKTAKNTADQFFNLLNSNAGNIEKVFKGADVQKWSGVAQSGVNGVLGVVSTVKDQIGNLSKINFSEAAAGGAAGIAKAAGQTLDGISAIGNSVFQGVIGIINEVNKVQIAEAEKQRDKEIQLIEETQKAKKEAIQKTLEEKKKGYETELEELAAREEEKNAVEEEWKEYQKEYEEKISEDMLAEDYEKLEEEKAAEEEKYTNKLENYKGDEENKKAILEQIRLAEEEAKNASDLADQEAYAKKEEAEKKFQNKKAEIQKKAAIAQKAMNIFNATISMLQGMAAAITAGMSYLIAAPAMVPLLVGMAASLGAAQIAAIIAQPIPEPPSFAEGGFVGKANDSLYNFVPKAKNGSDRTLAWLSEGEYVLPKNEALMYQRMAGDNINNYNSPESVKNINVYTTVNAMTNANPNAIAKMNAEAVVLAISRGY